MYVDRPRADLGPAIRQTGDDGSAEGAYDPAANDSLKAAIKSAKKSAIPETYIKRVLDIGVDGIVVPTLESAAEAKAIVAATRYRPQGGNRGVGYPESRAAHWGLKELEYPREYLDQLIVAAIVETKKGVENIKDILAVDGLDMLITGPGDLAADIEKDFERLTAYGSYDNPELNAMMEKMERTTKEMGRWLGGVARHPAQAPKFYAKGYDFVTITADIWLLADGAKRALKEAKP